MMSPSPLTGAALMETKMKIHYQVAAVVLTGVMVWGFSHWRYTVGYHAADTQWQQRQAEQERADALARLAAETRERKWEQQRQTDMNKVAIHAEEELAAARDAAADAQRTGQRLQHTVTTLQRQLAGREARRLSAAAAIGTDDLGGHPGVLFTELFRRADQRAGELAAYADRTRVKWQACERAYQAATHEAEK
ncbi:Protein of uncharacterised function (DUF2514) [Serratia quinivorans]|nr:hypothetical protein 377p_00001 [Serratia liquefaciens]ULG14315.1 hypothetical protein 28Fp_00027 [Serratia proteamaculans]CAI1210165.1 Protein of uncharacterised function (DUF2514) [Serratia quinivorans]ULG17313.1 hypothetical protein 10novelp1_00102 [Serratia proteamaculans]ULG17568.1 hypothetical protein Dp_00113 [Serratia proteamaculans]